MDKLKVKSMIQKIAVILYTFPCLPLKLCTVYFMGVLVRFSTVVPGIVNPITSESATISNSDALTSSGITRGNNMGPLQWLNTYDESISLKACGGIWMVLATIVILLSSESVPLVAAEYVCISFCYDRQQSSSNFFFLAISGYINLLFHLHCVLKSCVMSLKSTSAWQRLQRCGNTRLLELPFLSGGDNDNISSTPPRICIKKYH